MRFLVSWLKEYVPLNEPPRKLAELLTCFAFESSVATAMRGDAVLDVAVFPNRVGDCASHVGLARELAMILRRPFRWHASKPKESGRRAAEYLSVEVRDPSGCPRYSARVLTGVTVASSPRWLQKRLLGCGIRPINAVVDATNYVMLELGEPLHAFDLGKIADGTVFIRKARKGEAIEALDERTYFLTPDDLVIADSVGPLAIAGIKGGLRAGITRETKDVVLEAANFDPVSVRRTSRRLGLRTDSSIRFEAGIDPNLTVVALDRAASLIQELCGGEVCRGIVDWYPARTLPRPIRIDCGKLSALLGVPVRRNDIVRLLKPILVSAKEEPRGTLLLRIDTVRRDLAYPEDIAEEIARLQGYGALQPSPPLAAVTVPPQNESFDFRRILRGHLTALGLTEVYLYAFVGESDLVGIEPRQCIEVENPLSELYRYLRPSLAINLSRCAAANLRFAEDVRIFEVGKEYRWTSAGPREAWRVGMVITRRRGREAEVFFEAKGVIESLLERLGFDRDDYRFGDEGALFIGSEQIGVVRLLTVEERRRADLDAPAAYGELSVEELMRNVEEEHEFEPLHKYPDVIRDISVLLPREVRVADVENAIEGSGAELLEDVDLFDIYEGEGLPHGMVSMSFHLIFRAPDRTLTDTEVAHEMEKVVASLRALGAEIR
jgi:phenylalanyl-tRNA synthetase beta chain